MLYKRYINVLDPTINHSEWSEQEDNIVINYNEYIFRFFRNNRIFQNIFYFVITFRSKNSMLSMVRNGP